MEQEEEVIPCRVATPEEEALFKWADEIIVRAIETANEGLGRVATVAAALFAGLLAFFSQLHLPAWSAHAGLGLLLASVALALWGGLPRDILMDTHCAADIEEKRESVAAFKMNCLRAASLALLLAFAVVLLGLLFG